MEKYSVLLEINKNGLKTVMHLLDKAAAYCSEKSIAENVLLEAKLAPDMFDFTKQVQIASDDARRNLLLLAGKEHVRMEDTEKTIAELKTRITKTLSILEELSPADFAGADERHISLYWMGEHYVEGVNFVPQLAVPNFLFHVSMAYAILRKEGVSIGKQDFITTLNMKPKVG